MTQEQDKPKLPITPLWVIASFVSLSEIALTVGVIQTSGSIQIVLTAFVLLYPLLITGAFFAILWSRPYVLYPPTEYGKKTDVAGFVEAMTKRQVSEIATFESIGSTIRATLTSEEVINELSQKLLERSSGTTKDKVANLLNETADDVVEKVKQTNFFTIDTRPLLGNRNGDIIEVVYRPNSPIAEIYFLVNQFLRKYFDKHASASRIEWQLSDIESRIIIGTFISTQSGFLYSDLDTRPLSSLGIKPGMKLVVLQTGHDLSKSKTA